MAAARATDKRVKIGETLSAAPLHRAAGFDRICALMRADGLIIILEENPRAEAELREALAGQGIRNAIVPLRSAIETQSYLAGTGKYANRENFPIPEALVVSLEGNRDKALGLIRWIRRQPSIGSMAVLALGAGNDLRDVQEAYASGANAYFVRGADVPALARTLRAMQSHKTEEIHPAFREPAAANDCGVARRDALAIAPVLLVTDEEGQSKQVSQGLHALKLKNRLREVFGVKAAMDYLSGTEPYHDRAKHPFPVLLFVELRLAESQRLLAWMEARPAQRPAAIIALTSSHDMRPVIQAYHLGVHSFLKQPLKSEELRNALDALPRARLCHDETGVWLEETPAE